MGRGAATVVAALLAASALPGASAAAGATGGLGASDRGASGGARYGAALVTPPVARRFALTPRRVRADRRPAILLRVDQPRVTRVRAWLTVQRATGRPVRVELGRVRTGRTLRLLLPARARLVPGRYRVLLHATGRGAPLARSARARGEATLVVLRVPAPPRPAPPRGGVFPVRGPHSFGDGIGAAREGHTHQGVDVLAAEGTPVVAPTAGRIVATDYQRRGAGWYVVQDSDDGRSFFFAHCRTNTIAVRAGQRVRAGTPLCAVGHTGDARGPHLHFEIWVDGWRTDARSRFVDPLPQLRAWDT